MGKQTKRQAQATPDRYSDVSKTFITTPEGFLFSRGQTVNRGRRKEKNLIWAVKQAMKAERRALKKGLTTAGKPASTLP